MCCCCCWPLEYRALQPANHVDVFIPPHVQSAHASMPTHIVYLPAIDSCVANKIIHLIAVVAGYLFKTQIDVLVSYLKRKASVKYRNKREKRSTISLYSHTSHTCILYINIWVHLYNNMLLKECPIFSTYSRVLLRLSFMNLWYGHTLSAIFIDVELKSKE